MRRDDEGCAAESTLPALRVIVAVAVVIDTALAIWGKAAGHDGSGGFHPAHVVLMPLTAAVCVAVLWGWRTVAAVGAAVVVAGGLATTPSGQELWLIIIVGVLVGARSSPRSIVALAGGLVAYSAAWGWQYRISRGSGGLFAAAFLLAFGAAALLVGLVIRWVRRVREQERARADALAEANREIRSAERRRLAEELQRHVTAGLRANERLLAQGRGSDDPVSLRAALAAVDTTSRSVLTRVRGLLGALRAGSLEDTADPGSRVEGWRPSTGQLRRVDVGLAAVGVVGPLLLLLTSSAGPGRTIGLVSTALCSLLALRRPGIATGAAWVSGVLSFVAASEQSAWDAYPFGLAVLLRTATRGSRGAGVLLPVFAGYVVVVGLRFGPEAIVMQGGATAYLGLIGVALGLARHHYGAVARRSSAELAALGREQREIPRAERDAAARELHDVVAHQLSLITLLVMEAEDEDDPAVLHRILDDVGRATTAAHLELAELVRDMRGDAPQEPLPAVQPPTAVASAMAAELGRHGHRPRLDIDPAADTLDETSRRTLGRALQEATTNVLRHAAPGSECRIALGVGPRAATLTVTNPVAPSAGSRAADLSTGLGLRGLRERVDLTGGTFAAGPSDGVWTTSVGLPVAAGGRAGAVTPVSASSGRRPRAGST